jgi:hypothetical protein
MIRPILQRGLRGSSKANRIGFVLLLLFAATLAISLIQGLRSLRVS